MNFRSTWAICLLALVGCLANQANAVERFPELRRIQNLATGIAQLLGSLDDNLGNLLGKTRNLNRSLKEVADCYDAEIQRHGGRRLNIFNASLSFKDLVLEYYETFSNKPITRKSIKNLLDSTKDMVQNCFQSTRLSNGEYSTAKFGFTELSDKSLEEVRQLLGVKIPDTPAGLLHRKKRFLSANDAQCQPDPDTSKPQSFDWRNENAVTAVRNQGSCGSCWAFATAAAIESALIIRRKAPLSVDLSEQQMLNCAVTGGCKGAWSNQSFEYVRTQGICSESAKPYISKEDSCTWVPEEYRISEFCLRSRFYYTADSDPESLSDDTIARVLLQFGPMYITLDANPLSFRNYRSGVINTPACTTTINHAVLLVGYDAFDNSWIFKNSWGEWWGDKGYFKVIRNKNMCGVNTEIVWPIL